MVNGGWSSSPKPRWPASRWISPSALRNYQNCPQRVRFQLEERVTPPQFVLFFSKGNAAHAALKRIAEAMQYGREPITDDEVERMALLRLPPEEFPSPEMRIAQARDVVRWVRYGRQHLETMREPTWLIMERSLSREWNLLRGAPTYTVMAKPDLIVSRLDHDGQRLVDIIDYKTGKPRPETLQPVMLRFAARDLLESAGVDPHETRVQFTYLWLDVGQREVIDLSTEFCTDEWSSIHDAMKALASETNWPARPSFLCHYCPYHENHCQEVVPTNAFTADSGDWE